MNTKNGSVCLTLILSFVLALGCSTDGRLASSGSAPEHEVEGEAAQVASEQATSKEAASELATINEALANLSPEDRLLAESQKFCAIATESPLGSMGTPLKVEVNGEAVFLCCAGCKGKALRNPQETLASVAKLKAENGTTK